MLKNNTINAYRWTTYLLWAFLILYMSYIREFQTTEILTIIILVGAIQWFTGIKSMAQGMIAATMSKTLSKRFKKYRGLIDDTNDTLN